MSTETTRNCGRRGSVDLNVKYWLNTCMSVKIPHRLCSHPHRSRKRGALLKLKSAFLVLDCCPCQVKGVTPDFERSIMEVFMCRLKRNIIPASDPNGGSFVFCCCFVGFTSVRTSWAFRLWGLLWPFVCRDFLGFTFVRTSWAFRL